MDASTASRTSLEGFCPICADLTFNAHEEWAPFELSDRDVALRVLQQYTQSCRSGGYSILLEGIAKVVSHVLEILNEFGIYKGIGDQCFIGVQDRLDRQSNTIVEIFAECPEGPYEENRMLWQLAEMGHPSWPAVKYSIAITI